MQGYDVQFYFTLLLRQEESNRGEMFRPKQLYIKVIVWYTGHNQKCKEDLLSSISFGLSVIFKGGREEDLNGCQMRRIRYSPRMTRTNSKYLELGASPNLGLLKTGFLTWAGREWKGWLYIIFWIGSSECMDYLKYVYRGSL